ncbi:peptide deformylase [Spirosoma montaniterrae]|uniref:Peptide deformylase n=1 Tax=Spirosoma montaniterrae TaxID=1178516 RepID=A0A1P9X1P3_9BACT|nr:peptide deformylase [Spirosoma montaniterrae]AQG81537.1 peptide deformylase [Spirosoma montaniterrae]
MILPITAYGDPLLRKRAKDIEPGSVDVKTLSENMFETMYAASGVGLAAPQIGQSLRIFVVDGQSLNDDEKEEDIDTSVVGFKKVFINPEIVEEAGDDWGFEEGCLSIPGIRGEVVRPEIVVIRYFDIDWNEHEEEYDGMAARIIQHEYDHLEGKLFTDYLTPLKRQLIKRKLTDITKGKTDAEYKMKFPK